MKYKLLCTDIDRTFSRDKRVFIKNINYLKFLKRNGIVLVANSGRGLISGAFFHNLNLFDYFIGNDGAVIYDYKQKEIIYNNLIPSDIVNDLINEANKNKISWIAETNDNVYFSDTVETHKNLFVENSNYLFTYKKHIKCCVNRILVFAKNIEHFFSFIKNKYKGKIYYFLNNRTLELTKQGVSKGNALLFLLEKINIKPKDIVVIGDSINDISMLKLSKMSIAMGNSDSKVKNAVTYVTDDEKNFGWLKGIKKYE